MSLKGLLLNSRGIMSLHSDDNEDDDDEDNDGEIFFVIWLTYKRR